MTHNRFAVLGTRVYFCKFINWKIHSLSHEAQITISNIALCISQYYNFFLSFDGIAWIFNTAHNWVQSIGIFITYCIASSAPSWTLMQQYRSYIHTHPLTAVYVSRIRPWTFHIALGFSEMSAEWFIARSNSKLKKRRIHNRAHTLLHTNLHPFPYESI